LGILEIAEGILSTGGCITPVSRIFTSKNGWEKGSGGCGPIGEENIGYRKAF
jgi:hypothetical protein